MATAIPCLEELFWHYWKPTPLTTGTSIQVANLYDPELLLEVQAIAVIDES